MMFLNRASKSIMLVAPRTHSFKMISRASMNQSKMTLAVAQPSFNFSSVVSTTNDKGSVADANQIKGFARLTEHYKERK